MVVGDAIDGSRGDHDAALDAEFKGGLHDVAGAIDIGGHDILFRVERQSGGGVNDPVGAVHDFAQGGNVADIAHDGFNLIFFRVIEGYEIDRSNIFIAFALQVADKIDAEKAATASNKDFFVHGCII